MLSSVDLVTTFTFSGLRSHPDRPMDATSRQDLSTIVRFRPSMERQSKKLGISLPFLGREKCSMLITGR